ncbi:MAG: peptidylprolyl isomerase [Oceanospirillum sp.]|nr:peptidylprolyl isomerase [Oceanospirillum sp.]
MNQGVKWLACLGLATGLSGTTFAQNLPQSNPQTKPVVPAVNQPEACVKLSTTKGDILLVLDRHAAPQTSENFLGYVNDKFYDGTIFHRVIDGFMVQGGGFDRSFDEKETEKPISNESNNGMKNLRGTIAMARTSAPHTATSQFFINTVDNPGLDFGARGANSWGYAVFGKVVQGMEVVDAMSKVQTGMYRRHRDVPAELLLINSATSFGCVKQPVMQPQQQKPQAQ